MKNEGFVRDINNPGAVINTDNAGLEAYKLKKSRNKELDMMKSDLKEFKSEISELKDMMKKILGVLNDRN